MFQKLAEGNVFQTTAPGRATSGPRTALLPDGSLICTFMLQTQTGSNDFTPMAAYSKDGSVWSESQPVWPELAGKKSVFVSVRPTADGRLSLAGKMFPIDQPGEFFWSDEVGGMKENQLVFSLSGDGRSFPLPQVVDLPFYGSAEQPGGMLVDADGTMSMVYAPYPTIEQRGETDTSSLVLMRSTDGGQTFQGSKFGHVDTPSLYAESWIVRLSDGRLMVSSWQTASSEAPDQYFLSSDNGATFSGPHAMPFRGQTTALTPGPGGTVLVAYNQRKEDPAGVWLAVAKPDENGFHLITNEPVWKASETTQTGASSGEFDQWTDFAFGEPHVSILPDQTLLVTLWYQQGDTKGIRYVRLGGSV